MKRVFIFLFFLVLAFPKFALSQEKSSEQYYQDLLTNYRLYQKTITPFNIAQSRYLSYQSVDSQVEFTKATKDLLLPQTESIISFSRFIRSRLSEATKVINYQENYLYIKLDDELAFLSLTKEKIPSLSTLSDSRGTVDSLGEHYQKISIFAYQVKNIIRVGSFEKLFGNTKIVGDKLASFFEQLPEEQKEKIQIKSAEEKFRALREREEEVETLLKKAKGLESSIEKNAKSSDEEIKKLTGEVMEKIEGQIAGYQNIVFSLKQE